MSSQPNWFPLAPAECGDGRSGLVAQCPPHQLPYGIIFEEYRERCPDRLRRLVVVVLGLKREQRSQWEVKLQEHLKKLADRYKDLADAKTSAENSSQDVEKLQLKCYELERPLKCILHKMRSSALCLSGGGVRSASFSLGVLEGLAKFSLGMIQPDADEAAKASGVPEHPPKQTAGATAPGNKASGLLHKLDYISTVSGGGYIGSWLSSWIYRRWQTPRAQRKRALTERLDELDQLRKAEGNDSSQLKEAESAVQKAEEALRTVERTPLRDRYHEVIERLAGRTTTGNWETTSGDPEPRTVRHLREYTSFLAPAVGMSLDFWTLVAIALRNLFINWLMLIPILMAAVALPQASYYSSLYVASCIRLKCQNAEWMLVFPVGLVGVLFALAGSFAERNLPSHRAPSDTGPSVRAMYFLFCLPIMIANWLLVEMWWSVSGTAVNETQTLWAAVGIFTISLAGLFCLCNGILRAHQAGIAGKVNYWYLRLAIVIVAAFATGLAAVLAFRVFPWLMQGHTVLSALVTSNITLGHATSPAPGSWSVLCDQRLFMILAFPLFTLVPLLTISLFCGLLASFEREQDREWWARAGAIELAIIVAWVLMHAVSLYGADITWAINSAISGAGLGWVVSLIGKSGVTGSGSGTEKKNQISSVGSFLAKYHLVLPAISAAAILLLALGVAAGESKQASKLNLYLRAHSSFEAFTNGLLAHLAILAIAIALALCINLAISVNIFSLNGMYRMRLMRAFLGASNSQRQPDSFTGFDPSDTPRECDLPHQPGAPLHLINTTLNLVGTKNTAWSQRKGEPFSISPLHCGSWRLGYVPTRYYAGESGPTLATAMSISGAAFNPNMGYHSSPLVTLLMTFFNVRLGWWLPNPSRERGGKSWLLSPKNEDFLRRTDPIFALSPMIMEALGMTDDTYRWIELTDGGHFENLGLYEMVMRRCKKIIVVDAGADPNYEFEDLGNALRKIEIDLGIPIRFDKPPLMQKKPEDKNRYCAVATISYGAVDDGPGFSEAQRKQLSGKLIYIKASLTGQEPPDIKQYAVTHDEFPHESTMNQFFNEAQFESYRHLGLHEIETIVNLDSQVKKVQNFKQKAQQAHSVFGFDLFETLASGYADSGADGAGEKTSPPGADSIGILATILRWLSGAISR